MTDSARILIADDDETFLLSTADLLRREGYQCDCVKDADGAVQMLGKNSYEAMISDIKMPGNAELELIRQIPNIAEGTPVILVTGHPLLHSAIQSIELPVEAYLVKPLKFEELLERIRTAVKHSRVYRSVRSVKQRLQDWHKGTADIEKLLKDEGQKAFLVSLDTFLELTFQNIIGAVSDLKHLTSTLVEYNLDKEPCHLLNCPRLSTLVKGLTETIDALEESKNAFKSKNLGEIRKKLEKLIAAKE